LISHRRGGGALQNQADETLWVRDLADATNAVTTTLGTLRATTKAGATILHDVADAVAEATFASQF
jgi:hypothetical protein